MPEEILSLDISSDSVAAVKVTRRLKEHHVTACDHVMIEEVGGLEEALKALVERVGPGEICFSALPGEHVSYRNLRMPFRDKKKIRQTLLFELETIIPFPVEDLVVDFTIVDQSDQSEILAASLKRTYVSEQLEHLRANDIDPEVLDISGVPTLRWLLRQTGTPDDGLLLQIGRKSSTVILYHRRRIALIRTFSLNGGTVAGTALNGTGNGHEDIAASEQIESSLRSFCTELKNTLHVFEWQNKKTVHPEKVFVTGSGALRPDTEDLLNRFLDLPVERVDLSRDPGIYMDEEIAGAWNPALMDNALALAVRKTKEDLGFNFRRDAFEVKKEYFGHRKEVRKVAAFLIIVLFLLSLDLGADYYFLKQRYNMLDGQITKVFKETFPDTKRIVNPVHQMKVRINEIKKTALSIPGIGANAKVLDLIRDVSVRVPESADVHVSRMVVDANTVLIKGETDTFNTVDTIKKGLEPSDYFSAVTISSANLDRSGNRVKFEMKLQRAE